MKSERPNKALPKGQGITSGNSKSIKRSKCSPLGNLTKSNRNGYVKKRSPKGKPSALTAGIKQLCSTMSPGSEGAKELVRQSFVGGTEANTYSNIGPYKYGFGAALNQKGLAPAQKVFSSETVPIITLDDDDGVYFPKVSDKSLSDQIAFLGTPFHQLFKSTKVKPVATVLPVKSATLLIPETVVKGTVEATAPATKSSTVLKSEKVAQTVRASHVIIDVDREEESVEDLFDVCGDYDEKMLGVGAIFLPTTTGEEIEMTQNEQRLYFSQRMMEICSNNKDTLETQMRNERSANASVALTKKHYRMTVNFVHWSKETLNYCSLVKDERNAKDFPGPILESIKKDHPHLFTPCPPEFQFKGKNYFPDSVKKPSLENRRTIFRVFGKEKLMKFAVEFLDYANLLKTGTPRIKIDDDDVELDPPQASVSGVDGFSGAVPTTATINAEVEPHKLPNGPSLENASDIFERKQPLRGSSRRKQSAPAKMVERKRVLAVQPVGRNTPSVLQTNKDVPQCRFPDRGGTATRVGKDGKKKELTLYNSCCLDSWFCVFKAYTEQGGTLSEEQYAHTVLKSCFDLINKKQDGQAKLKWLEEGIVQRTESINKILVVDKHNQMNLYSGDYEVFLKPFLGNTKLMTQKSECSSDMCPRREREHSDDGIIYVIAESGTLQDFIDAYVECDEQTLCGAKFCDSNLIDKLKTNNSPNFFYKDEQLSPKVEVFDLTGDGDFVASERATGGSYHCAGMRHWKPRKLTSDDPPELLIFNFESDLCKLSNEEMLTPLILFSKVAYYFVGATVFEKCVDQINHIKAIFNWHGNLMEYDDLKVGCVHPYVHNSKLPLSLMHAVFSRFTNKKAPTPENMSFFPKAVPSLVAPSTAPVLLPTRCGSNNKEQATVNGRKVEQIPVDPTIPSEVISSPVLGTSYDRKSTGNVVKENFESLESDASESSSNFEIATVQATLDSIPDSMALSTDVGDNDSLAGFTAGNFESSEPDASRSSSNFEIATVQATLDFILDSIDSMGNFESSEPDASRSSSNFEIATVQATLDFILDSIDSMDLSTDVFDNDSFAGFTVANVWAADLDEFYPVDGVQPDVPKLECDGDGEPLRQDSPPTRLTKRSHSIELSTSDDPGEAAHEGPPKKPRSDDDVPLAPRSDDNVPLAQLFPQTKNRRHTLRKIGTKKNYSQPSTVIFQKYGKERLVGHPPATFRNNNSKHRAERSSGESDPDYELQASKNHSRRRLQSSKEKVSRQTSRKNIVPNETTESKTNSKLHQGEQFVAQLQLDGLSNASSRGESASRTYACPQCEAVEIPASKFAKHSCKLEDKFYYCRVVDLETCGLKFETLEAANTHMVINHPQEFQTCCLFEPTTVDSANKKIGRPFRCSFKCDNTNSCDQTCKDRNTLFQHCQYKHPLVNFNYVCNVCKLKTPVKKTLIAHLRKWHIKDEGYYVHCTKCEFLSTSAFVVKRHFQTIHPNEGLPKFTKKKSK